MKFGFNTIKSRIIFGFVIMTALILTSALLASWQGMQLAEINERMREVRGPTMNSALIILNGVNQSQSEVKSWLLTGEKIHQERRRDVWNSDIQPAVKVMSELVPRWVWRSDVEVFRQINEQLTNLEKFQIEMETLPRTSPEIRRKNDAFIELATKLRANLEGMIDRRQKVIADDMEYQALLISRLNMMQVLLILLGGIIGVGMGYSLIRSIAGPIQQTIDFANQIADGQYNEKNALVGTEEVNRLGAALERMRGNLESKTWLNNSQISFNEGVRSVKSLRELADAAVGEMARSLNALTGVFYVREERKLRALGGFARSSQREPGFEFGMGEGLVGQAAADKNMIVVPCPENSGLQMSLAAGEIKPVEVLALPLVLNNQVIGAMEFGLSASLQSHEKEFLKITGEVAAVVLDAVQKGEQVKNLLAETQTQSEELQAQQEELRSANEELQTRQEELESTNEELEEQKSLLETQKSVLDHKNAELEDTQKALSERAVELNRVNQYKSEFLANMSHELRTPLNSQLILSRLLEENKEGNLSDKQKEFAKIIHSTGLDLLQLINDILDLSKVEAGKLDLEVRDCSLAEIIGECERDFRQLIENKGLRFEVTVDKSVPDSIRTDSHRLLQVLKNFLSNAVKFTSQGQIKLKVAKPSATEPKISFSVSDTGIGIPPEKLQTIFQAFEQVDSSVSRQYGGTGLGLAISRSIAGLLGGEISLESRMKEGSTFTLVLPETLVSQQVPAVPAAAEPVPLNKVKTKVAAASVSDNLMLIIEDDTTFAKILVDLAKQKGFEAIIAEDGTKGIELAHSRLPSCILLDYRLPGMNGLNVLRELKNSPATKHIPVHMISVDDRASEAHGLGAVGYLVKPVDAGQILEAMGRLGDLTEREVRRVLVIEDDRVQRDEIIRRITEAKLTAIGVGNAQEALDHLRNKSQIDCMIVDLSLPDMSGIELLKRVRDQKENSKLPAIVYTSKDLSREEEETLLRYSDSIIIKGARSGDRLVDELNLFLNKVARDLPKESRQLLSASYEPEKVFENKEILLVDDDIRNVFSLSSALEGKGFKISLARNGQEALNVLSTNPKINLVLMDIMMPIMDGYEATRKIRENSSFAKLPVIALTAKAMKGDREACIAAGASDYLSKPVDIDRLLSLLRVWLA